MLMMQVFYDTQKTVLLWYIQWCTMTINCWLKKYGQRLLEAIQGGHAILE